MGIDWSYFSSYGAHGMCYRWQIWLILLHVISDLVTFVDYAIAGITLISSRRLRIDHFNHIEDSHLGVLFAWLGMFILTCGLVHLTSAAMTFYPYQISFGLMKAINAFVSTIFIYHLVVITKTALKYAPRRAHGLD